MAIQILTVHQQYPDKIFAKVKHYNHIFNAYVVDKRQDFSELIGQDTIVEIAYEQLHSWRRIKDYQDEMSCICENETETHFIVRGRVHNLIPIDGATVIIDIYLPTGAEFVDIASDELNGEMLEIGEGVELEVSGLCFFPVNL
ncbi:MAG: hypothetical protein AAF485_06520 [Chloroflexota bacterium]